MNPTLYACAFNLPKGSTIVLTESGGPSFVGWGGDCASTGTDTTCTLTLDGDKSVRALWIENS